MATTALQMTVNPMHGNKMRNGNAFNDSPKKALNGTALKKAAGRKKLVKRDPITGEGANSKEPNDFGRTSNNPETKARKAFNEELIKWNLDEEPTPLVERPKSSRVKSALERNPVSMQGDLGKEVDSLMTTNKPRVGTPRDPVRNPINGNGNFGQREWDPVWRHAGKIRRAKSTTNDRSNPLTGDNTNGYVVSVEEKNRQCMTPRANRSNTPRNALTGQNCETYTVSTELRDKQSKRDVVKRNALTGENCKSYEINVENANKNLNRSSTMNFKKSNPVSGENVTSFDVSLEQRPKSSKPYVYSNTVTGENRSSYKINPNERNVSSKTNKNMQNPVSGENVKSYTYRSDEKVKNVKIRDLASPLTGGGSRGLSYSVSIEERKTTPSTPIATTRNILTGENCQTYMVSQEMRSERKPVSNNGFFSPQVSLRPLRNANYNIITGEDK